MSPTIMIGAGMVLTGKPSPSQSACASCATSPARVRGNKEWI